MQTMTRELFFKDINLLPISVICDETNINIRTIEGLANQNKKLSRSVAIKLVEYYKTNDYYVDVMRDFNQYVEN